MGYCSPDAQITWLHHTGLTHPYFDHRIDHVQIHMSENTNHF